MGMDSVEVGSSDVDPSHHQIGSNVALVVEQMLLKHSEGSGHPWLEREGEREGERVRWCEVEATFLPVSSLWSSSSEEILRVVYSVSAAVPAPPQLTEREREGERERGGKREREGED